MTGLDPPEHAAEALMAAHSRAHTHLLQLAARLAGKPPKTRSRPPTSRLMRRRGRLASPAYHPDMPLSGCAIGGAGTKAH